MIAGVTMNVLLAFVVLTVLALTYGEPVIGTRVVGAVHPLATAPALSQLRAGDTIVAVNGKPVRNWNEIAEGIEGTSTGAVTLRTTRGEASVPVGTPGTPTSQQVVGAVDFYMAPVIGDVLPGSPAKRSGLQVGDTIVTIGGAPVTGWSQLQEKVMPSAGVALPFQVRRGGKLLGVTVTPESTSQKDPSTGQMRSVGKIGAAAADPTTREPIGLGAAVVAGARGTWITAGKIVGTVRGLITREVSVRQLGGPIAITRASVAAAQSGLESRFFLLALLSGNVAVLNLLPIPILDGGQILINIAESVKGSPFSARTRENILRFGLVAILLIFVMSTFNDVVMGVKDIMAKLFG
jgi:regulator of sigma E protease